MFKIVTFPLIQDEKEKKSIFQKLLDFTYCNSYYDHENLNDSKGATYTFSI